MSNKGAGAVTEKDDQSQGLVPTRRFPEFWEAEPWKLRELSMLLSEPKKKNRDLKYGPEHVLSVSGEYGCVNQIEFMGRSYAGASVKEYNVVEAGDIVYTKSPLKACPNGIIKANKGATGIFSVLYAVYRPTAASRSDFLDYYFSSDHKLNTYLQPLVKKGPKNSILVNNSDVLKGRIAAPDVIEQQKIAECLSSLDALIAAEADKLAALRDHKKGLMHELFPAEGQTTPRLRFPEFRDAGEWEATTIGQVGKFYYGKSAPKWSLDENAPTPCVRYGELYTKFGPIITETYSKTNIPPEGLKFSKGGEILVPRVGEKPDDFGRNCSLLTLSGIAIGEMISVFETDQNAQFYTFYFRNIYRAFAKVVEGQNVKNLYYAVLEPLPIFRPSVREQEKIADCLLTLEATLADAEAKIAQLGIFKQSLMQQLFPSPVEAVA